MAVISKLLVIRQPKFRFRIMGHLVTASQNFIELAWKTKMCLFRQFYFLNKNADPAVKISPGAKVWQSYESKLFVQFRCNPFSRFYGTRSEGFGQAPEFLNGRHSETIRNKSMKIYNWCQRSSTNTLTKFRWFSSNGKKYAFFNNFTSLIKMRILQ